MQHCINEYLYASYNVCVHYLCIQFQHVSWWVSCVFVLTILTYDPEKLCHLDPLIILLHLRFTEKIPECWRKELSITELKYVIKYHLKTLKKEYTFFSDHKKGIDELRAGVELHMHVR